MPTITKTKPALSVEHVLHLKAEAKKFVQVATDKKEYLNLADAYCQKHGLGQWAVDVAMMFETVWDQDAAKASKGQTLPKPIGALTLLHKQIAPPEWVLTGLLPVGLTILAGKPKCGKSWLAYDLVLALSTGAEMLGVTPVEGPALMLALEDTEYRLQDRMRTLLLDEKPTDDAQILTSCAGVDELAGLMEQTAYRLVVVDTLQRFRPKAAGSGNAYAKDYDDLAALKALADKHGASILVIHHTRKQASADPFDEVSGTLGLNGCADTILVLKREPSTDYGTLHIRGRDVEEQSTGLRFAAGKWRRHGEFTATPNAKQAAIMALLDQSDPLSPKQVAEHILGKAPTEQEANNMAKGLNRLAEKLFIAKVGHGKYWSITKEQEKAL